jgi:predicted transcriptional regulator
MDLLAAGKSNSEIATAMGISHQTVKNTVTEVYAQLGVSTRGQAISLWVKPDKRAQHAIRTALKSIEHTHAALSAALANITET